MRYKSRKRSNREEVESRFLVLSDALEREQEILSATNPLTVLSSIASKQATPTHPYRYQVDFFVYVLHGRNIWSLKRPTHRIGRWLRTSLKHAKRKFGLKSLNPETAFLSPLSDEVRKQCVASYKSRAALGKCLTKIHGDALMKDFGCMTFVNASGVTTLYHPENKPFPSYSQFRRVVHKEFGSAQVRSTLYGKTRVHEEAAIEVGRYYEQYANLLEAVEADVYFVDVRPHGILHDGPGDRLCVARAICVTTGACVGIGFSIGGERQDAYRAMLFCMAVPKSYIARLYGIEESLLSTWKTIGVLANLRTDRGVAGHPTLVDEDQFRIKTIVKSYGKQSKSPVEAGHRQ